MNPLSPNAAKNRVRRELWAILAAWPTAEVTRHGDGLSAVVIIREPQSTYVIEVTPDGTQSLHVPHRALTNGLVHTPLWADGWVD